jgi:hypothetical protein
VAKHDSLAARYKRQEAIITLHDREKSKLQHAHERDRAALQKLRGKRGADRRAVDDWSRKVGELNEIRDEHIESIAMLHQDNGKLEEKVHALSEFVTKKDEELLSLRRALVSAGAESRTHDTVVKERGTPASSCKEDVGKQSHAYRKLSDLFAEKANIWIETQESNNRAACIAQAETCNNHANWLGILQEKNAVIAGLEATLRAATAEGNLAKHTHHVVKTHQDLHKKNSALSKEIKSFKMDVQNLLDTNQSKTNLLTSYMGKIEALQAERTAAVDQVAQLNEQLAKRNKYASHLQRIIATAAAKIDQNNMSSTEDYVPRAIVNGIVTEAMAEYYTQAEHLLAQLRDEQETRRDVQAKLDQCDKNLFEYQTEEQDRLAEVVRLERTVQKLESQEKILEDQIKNCHTLVEAANTISNPHAAEMHRLILAQVHPLQTQNRKLISENCNLLNDIDRCKDETLETRARWERKIETWRSLFKDLETHFWDVAVNEHDMLHEELARWKRKCGREHFYSSAPSSRLVHDRRLLQYALLEGTSGLTTSMIPKEYFNPDFLKGCHSAVEMALRKLWPDFWRYLNEHAAWVPLTVPLLTGEGEILMDDATRAESDARLETFKAELKTLDEKLEEAHRKAFDIEADSDSDESEGPHEEDDSDDSKDHVDARSDTPNSDNTEDTSPPSSVRTREMKDVAAVTSELDDSQDEQPEESTETQENDELPGFAKKILARISAQEVENEQLAGYIADQDIDEEAFLAQYGQDIMSKPPLPHLGNVIRLT